MNRIVHFAKLLSFTIVLLTTCLNLAHTQVTLWSENFETDGEGVRYTSNSYSFCPTDPDYFLRGNTNPFIPAGCVAGHGSAVTLCGTCGTFFWGSEDIMSNQLPFPGNHAPGSIQSTLINISGYTSLKVSLYLAAASNNNLRWETADSINIQASINGGAYMTVGRFMGNNVAGGNLIIDANLNGVYDAGSEATPICDISTMTKYTFNIPGSGSTLSVKLDYDQYGGTEELATDLIEVTGIASAVGEINLKQNTTSVPNAGSFNYGTVPLGSNTNKFFYIENTGVGTLTLTGVSPNFVTKGGSHPGDFTIVQPIGASISPSTSKIFSVIFTPGGAGARSCTLNIPNDDTDENPYTITLNGNATTPTITVANPGVATGTQLMPFSKLFVASGGTPIYSYSTSSSLPTGLTLTTAGLLHGTPTVSGTFPIVVTATDAAGYMGTSSTYNLVISSATLGVARWVNNTAGTRPAQVSVNCLLYNTAAVTYTDIQSAINAAATGDVVYVTDGTYSHTVIADCDIVGLPGNNYITVIGKTNLIITSSTGSYCNSAAVITGRGFAIGSGGNVTIQGLELQNVPVNAFYNSNGTGGLAAYSSTQNVTIKNNYVLGTYGHGIKTDDGAPFNFMDRSIWEITGNTFENIGSYNPGSCSLGPVTAIWLGQAGAHFNIFDNTITNTRWAGILCVGQGGENGVTTGLATISGNRVHNTVDAGIQIGFPAGPAFYYPNGVNITHNKITNANTSSKVGIGGITILQNNIYGVSISYNDVSASFNGLAIEIAGWQNSPDTKIIKNNNFYSLSGGFGVTHIANIAPNGCFGTPDDLDTYIFSNNYWGAASGPTYFSNPSGTGVGLRKETTACSGVILSTNDFAYVPFRASAVTVNSVTACSSLPPAPNTITRTSAAATTTQTVCQNTAITNITYSTTGATGATFSGLPAGVTGAWASNIVTISGSPSTAVGSPFSYTVTLTGGCGALTATGTITVLPAPTTPVITGPTAVCTGSNATLNAGAGYSIYAWSNSGGSAQTATFSNITSPTTYNVTVTAANGCSATDNHAISVNALPSCTITGPAFMPHDTLCTNNQYVYSAPPGMSAYKWIIVGGNGTINGSSTSSSVTVTPTSGVNFTVRDTVTDANGCKSTCFLSRPVQGSPTCTLNGPNSVCAGSTGNVYTVTTNGVTPLWSISGSGTITGASGFSVTVTAGASGSYTVNVTTQFGNQSCTQMCSKSTTINPLPLPVITGPTAVCSGDNATLDAGVGYSIYAWSHGGGSSQMATFNNITTPTTYTVTVTDGNGCTSTDTHLVGVNACAADLSITKTDGSNNYTPGSSEVYTIVIKNNGPASVVGATVSDILPAVLNSVSWTSATSGSSAVTSGATGVGNTLAATINLGTGVSDYVTFTVSSTISMSAMGQLLNTASVSTPMGTTDPNTLNNMATDSSCNSQVYMSVANGMYDDPATWGGCPPPNPIPPGVIVNINHNIINDGPLVNNGTLTINGGGVFTNNGMYKGNGAFTGGLFTNPVGGNVSPGSSPGCLSYGAGYTNLGTLNIEVNGTTTACTDYDQLIVTGTATLGGTLNVTIGYTPSPGDQVTFIDATTVSGTFATLIAPPGWSVLYDSPSAGKVTLSFACPGGTVTNVNTSLSYCTIQAAIDAVATLAGHTISVGAGTYNERVTITKGIKLQGADSLTTIIDGMGLLSGGVGLGSGIRINSGITNVTIKNLSVKNFLSASGTNANAGIWAQGGNNNLLIDTVSVFNNVGGSGIYVEGAGGIDSITITNSRISGHTGGARGIGIWNGLKTKINISNNHVYGNVCCGIELQTGTSSGVTMNNNNVHDNGDNGMSANGLTGPGVNVISGNTLVNNGRFGMEIKNPDGTGAASGPGSIVVSNNNVSRTNPVVDSPNFRDVAGIAVFRRDLTAANVNVPKGVRVLNNNVSGYVQPNAVGEGYGIVAEGLDHTVSTNTLNGNDIGIQRQAGNTPYTALPAIVNGDQAATNNYFGRGNSPITCNVVLTGNIFGNILANGIDTRDVGLPEVTSVSNNGPICPGGGNAVFTLTGTANAIVTYNINGGGSTTVTLDGSGTGMVTIIAPSMNQTLNLVSIAITGGSCREISGSSTATVMTAYTSVQDGAYNNPATWGGCPAPNPIPMGVTVNMNHNITNNTTLVNNGSIMCMFDFINTPTGILKGTGTISCKLVNQGTVRPGN